MNRPRKLWRAHRLLIARNELLQIELAEHPTRDSLCVISLQHPDFVGWRGFSLTKEEAAGLYTKLGKWLKEPKQ